MAKGRWGGKQDLNEKSKSKCRTVCRVNFVFNLSSKCKVSYWEGYVSCLQYFSKPILFPTCLWAHCALWCFLVTFESSFSFLCWAKMTYFRIYSCYTLMLKSSQLQNAWSNLGVALKKDNTFFCTLFLYSTCTILSRFKLVNWQTPAHFHWWRQSPESLQEWVTSTLSYEFFLIRQ